MNRRKEQAQNTTEHFGEIRTHNNSINRRIIVTSNNWSIHLLILFAREQKNNKETVSSSTIQ